MDRQKLSLIAHTDHPIAAPVSDDAVDGLIAMFGTHLQPVLRQRSGTGEMDDALVLDIGCGTGEWLIRIVEQYRAFCVGVDLSPGVLEQARSRAADRVPSDRVTFVEGDAREFDAAGERFDLVLCVGASHAVGDLASVAGMVRTLVKPGGLALLGEGFWEREPSGTLREMFGELEDLAGTIDMMSRPGLIPLYAHVSTSTEWDDYEWQWTGALERYVREHPEDPDVVELRAGAARHRQEYLRGYRGTLGFVTCLLQGP